MLAGKRKKRYRDLCETIIKGMTGINSLTLEECGLTCVGIPMLVGLLKKILQEIKSRFIDGNCD